MPKRKKDRLTRTMLLGTAALALFCWVLVEWWDVDPGELLDYIGLSLLLVAVMAVLGVGGALLLRLLKRLFGN